MDAVQRLGPSYECPRCHYKPPHKCDDCGEHFPSRRHLASHRRYQHGVGYRKPNADGSPVEPPPKPTPAAFAEQLVKVTDVMLALPKIRSPWDARTASAIRDRVATIILGAFADPTMTEAERVYWRSVEAYFGALPMAITQQREIEEEATRQKLRSKGLSL